MKCDAVFEGGGVNGVALCGAVAVVESLGYEFNRVAGTSAGSIVACLIAGGYGAESLIDIVGGTDYRRFCDKGGVDKLPIIGPVLSVMFENGLFEGDFFVEWMRDLMDRSPKKIRTFGDVKDNHGRYTLQMIATDISRSRMLVLPNDLVDYDVDPDTFDIAMAARMSMSIPFFFETVRLQHKRGPCHIVDGGVLSNFPIWLFDRRDGHPPRWPTFGFLLEDFDPGGFEHEFKDIRGPIQLCSALVHTMLDARDKRARELSEAVRTIHIDTLGNSGINFSLDDATRDRLYASGARAAGQFFKKWDFQTYIDDFRR